MNFGEQFRQSMASKRARAPNKRLVCTESYHLLIGESPILVTVRWPGSRHPVQSGDRMVRVEKPYVTMETSNHKQLNKSSVLTNSAQQMMPLEPCIFFTPIFTFTDTNSLIFQLDHCGGGFWDSTGGVAYYERHSQLITIFPPRRGGWIKVQKHDYSSTGWRINCTEFLWCPGGAREFTGIKATLFSFEAPPMFTSGSLTYAI